VCGKLASVSVGRRKVAIPSGRRAESAQTECFQRGLLNSNAQIRRLRLRFLLVARANSPIPTNAIDAGSGVAAAP
jgi:hypothetical protein